MRNRIYPAQEKAEQATRLAVEVGSTGIEVSAWRILSEIDLSLGDAQSAQHAIDQAASLAEIHSPLEQGHVATQTGRIHLALGETALAAECFGQALTIYRDLGAEFYLANIEMLLQEKEGNSQVA